MKKLFIVLWVVIKTKPCALFALFLLICGKPHAPAALGKPSTSGPEPVGLHRVWGSLPTAVLPHRPPPALPLCLPLFLEGSGAARAATGALQRVWAALHS